MEATPYGKYSILLILLFFFVKCTRFVTVLF